MLTKTLFTFLLILSITNASPLKEELQKAKDADKAAVVVLLKGS